MNYKNLNLLDDLRWLPLVAPEFKVNGECIEILQSPGEFHSTLKECARASKKRIVLAALYLGTGTLESDLLKAVHDAAKTSQGDLEITILMDFVRGSRGQKNSVDMLKPIFEQCANSGKLKVYLYHTPNLRGILQKILPERWNETIGVAHLKVFIFDESFIISGANLSHDYFVDRQDRYMMFHNCTELSNYFHTLVNTIGEFSFRLSSNGTVTIPPVGPHPFNGDLTEFIVNANKRVKSMIQSFLQPIAKKCQLHEEYCKLPQSVHESNAANHTSMLSSSSMFNFTSKSIFESGIVAFQDLHHQVDTSTPSSKNHDALDTCIYPTIQMGLLGIRQDEIITKLLLQSFTSGSKVCLTTGYFNITDEYSDMIVNSHADYDILLSSPEANGFFNSAGFSRHIPQVYNHLCKEFFNKVNDAGRKDDFSLLEYVRNGWTFHGKGIWHYPSGDRLPNMTLIGSPNYGSRSVNRDLEAQLLVVTENEKLRERLHNERNNLVKYTKPISASTFDQPRYYVPRWVAFVTNFIKIYF